MNPEPVFKIWDRIEWPLSISEKRTVWARGTIFKIMNCSRFEMGRSCKWHYIYGFCYEILVDGTALGMLIQPEENIRPLCLLDRIVEALE